MFVVLFVSFNLIPPFDSRIPHVYAGTFDLVFGKVDEVQVLKLRADSTLNAGSFKIRYTVPGSGAADTGAIPYNDNGATIATELAALGCEARLSLNL